ncbi:MAG: PAS domain S-box protein [Mariniphaga sp.]
MVRKIWMSAIMGATCLLLSPYGLAANLGEIRIDIPWALFLPMLASMAYGWRFGLVAGLAGGAYFPFLLWANNGYANLSTTLTYLCIYALLGLPKDFNFFNSIKALYIRYIICLAIGILAFYFYFLFLFQPLLSFNPAFWVHETIKTIPRDILYGFAFKDSVNLVVLTLIAETLLQLPFIRKTLGLSIIPSMGENNKIFIGTIIASIFVWLTFVGLGIVLFDGENDLRQEHISLAFLVMITSGIILARILFLYNEKQYNIKYQLNKSEEKYRNIFENVHDVFYRIDLQGKVLEISPSINHLAGFGVEEIIGKPFDILSDNPEEGAKLLNSIQKDIVLTDYEIKLKTKTGKVKYASLNASLITNADGQSVYVEGIMRDITRRKQAEDSLRRNEAIQAKMVANIGDVIVIIDKNEINTYKSPNIEKWFGWRPEEVVGQNTYENIHPEDVDGAKIFFRRLLLTPDATGTTEIRYRCKAASYKWIEISMVNLIHDPDIQGVLGNYHDISDRKRATEMFDNERILLRTLIDNIPDSIYSKDFACRKTLANLTEVRYMGANSESEVLGMTDFELYPADLAEKFYADDQMVLQTGKALLNREEFIIDEKGEKRHLLSSKIPIRDKNNQVIGLVGIGRDITIRKRSEENFILAKEKAEESEQRLITFINSIPDIICYKDYCGRWMLANDADLELFGLTNVDYIGKTDAELAPFTHQIYYEAFRNCMVSDEKAWLNGKITRGTENIPTPAGKLKCYDVLKIPVFHPNGDRKGLAVIGRDITEFINIQNELEIAKERAEGSNYLKTTFLSNISHEIRTPFNSLLGFLNLATDSELNDEERAEYIGLVNQSSYRLMNTINDIVEISQIQTGQMEVSLAETSINQLIDNLYRQFKPEAEKKKLQFTIINQLHSQFDLLTTDVKKLGVILSNLIGNALKFTESGSIEVAIRTEEIVDQREKYNAFIINDLPAKLLFSVKDTGIGIPKEKQAQIFGLFMQGDSSHTRSFEGCGLGLSISKAYVEMLGGEIWVESGFNEISEIKGTVFHFNIPFHFVVEQKTIVGNGEPSKASGNNLKNLIVLIAEDDEASAVLISITVKTISKQIIKVKNGHEAVEACRQNPEIDLVLMDIKMPGLDGYEATQQIRQFNTNVTIIAQTANALYGDREKALAAGCNEYIEKPIVKEKLLALINGSLRN